MLVKPNNCRQDSQADQGYRPTDVMNGQTIRLKHHRGIQMLSAFKQVTLRVKKLQGVAGRATGKLPAAVQSLMSRGLGYPQSYDGLNNHLKVLLAVRKLQKGSLVGDDHLRSRRQFEEEMASLLSTPTAVSAVQDFVMETATGKIPARLYTAKPSAKPFPLLVFYHGGGFVVGSLDTHDEACRILCKYADVAVLSVDYRLAPEHKAPAAADDCVAAFQWAVANAAKLGVDPQRIAVGGDSAGGNLSAVVCQQLLGQKVQPIAQLLIYPTVDLANNYPSHQRYGRDLFISTDDMAHVKKMYVGGSNVSFDDPKVSPLFGTLEGLPRAHLVIAEFDVLRDEALLYAEKLKQAGVACTIDMVNDQGHGFINITSVHQPAFQATIRIAQTLKTLVS